MEINQFVEFSSAVLRSLPRDMDPTTTQSWITNQRVLADILRKALVPDSVSVAIQVSAVVLQPPYEGWELVDNDPNPVGTLELELSEFLEPGEKYVEGDVMRDRAKKSGLMLGEQHARALLEQQECIPEAWRKFYLVFPGTVWRGRGGGLSVPYLYWYGGRWDLGFGWLGGGWVSGGRFVSLRK